MIKIVLPFTPRTKKNSMKIYKNFSTGKSFPTPSDSYKQYLQDCMPFMTASILPKGIDSRVNVKCLFYMGKRIKIDLPNLLNAADDAMVHWGLLKDDNSSIVAGHDGSRVLYDKEFPRTEIIIERMEESN